MRWIFCFIFVSSCLYGEQCCPQVRTRNRSDEIPVEHVAWQDDEYLTGYIQSLVDMNYFEFKVRIIVQEHVAYVYNLPKNEVTAQSILCFVRGVPCIQDVRRMTCCAADAGRCSMPTPYCQTRGIWFPYTTVLFAPLIADPRQVTNSGAIRFNDDVIGKRVGAVTFGDDFGIYRWIDVWRWHGDLEFLVQAGIFSVFDLSDPKYCLVNTDFFVAPMLEYAFDWWSFRYRLWHMSSHLGDEFLMENPGFDRRNLSDEGTDFFVSLQLCQPLRLYAGLGYVFGRDEEFPHHPWYFQWGVEVRVFGSPDCYHKVYVQPFLAMNFSTWEMHSYGIDQTYALGVEWSTIRGIGRKLRIFAEFHDGYSLEGQFVLQRSNYSALRLMYGY